MAVFQKTETIVLSITVKNSSGTLTDPATSMKVTVYDPFWSVVVNDQAMTNDGVGLYHYDYTPASSVKSGEYEVRYKATDGTRITIEVDHFELED